MSNPVNELAKYRSYSYYHVLAMCDSSQTAVELSGQTSLDVWQHATAAEVADGTSIQNKYAVKSLPGGGKYCILINGATDATFTITHANWTSFTAASATMNDRNTSNALEGKISISEPRGIIFLDQVVRCCFELGVDSANTFWALKTFFVGYTDQDTVEYINTVPPVIFIAYDVVGNFGVVGGEYEISFVAAANGAARLPHYSKSARATNIKADGTFAGTLKNLQKDIRDNYKAYFKCVHDQVAAMPGGGELAESLREVTYHIDCGLPYVKEDGTANEKYTVTDQVAQSKDLAFCDHPNNIHVSAGVSIEDAIHRIIGMSKEIKDEASEGVNGVKYTTKIQTWVESKPGDKGLQFDVGYRVERQIQPRSVTFEQFSEGGELTPEMQKNVIEFDYIYTGKNIDITEFDIKMNMGMVYLQGMTIANPYKQPGDQTAVTASAPAGIDLSGRATGKNIPVFFGTQIKTASIRDTTDIKTTSQNAYSMTKHASLEMLEATVKIAGNSQLLGCINHISSPDAVKNSTRYQSDEALAKFAEWGFAPSFAKINIKMPRNNDDIALFTGAQTGSETTQSTDYAVDFWFTGYYYVYGVEHVFDNGEFYQVLNALGIPEKNSFKVTQDKTQQRDADLSKNVESCYEKHIGCGSSSSTSGGNSTHVAPEPRGSTTSPAKQSITPESTGDAAAANKNNTSLSGIKGYDEAPQEVKDAIKKAAAEEGVDEVTLAQMCAAESKFKPNAANKFGYKGLFQFGNAGWKDYGSGNIYDPYDNAKAGAKMMRHNQDVLAKQMGREPTRGELYMAHQQGLGKAKSIMKKIDRGGADATRGGLISSANAANNRIGDTSAEGIHNAMEVYMAKQLKHPIPIVDNNNVSPLKQRTATDPERNTGSVSDSKPAADTPVTAREMVAATNSCAVQEKQQSDPDKRDTCTKGPSTDSNVANESSTVADANKITTGQATPKESLVVIKKDPIKNVLPLISMTEEPVTILGDHLNNLGL